MGRARAAKALTIDADVWQANAVEPYIDVGKRGRHFAQIKALGEVAEEVEDGNMPMQIYINMHPEADLTVQQRELIVSWSEELAEKIMEN